MRSNALRELPELVVAEVDHGLVERPLGDAAGGALEPPDAASQTDAATMPSTSQRCRERLPPRRAGAA